MKRILGICLFLFFIAVPGALLGADTLGALKGKGGPIEITSDRLDAYNEEKLVVFSGNVVSKQEDKTIYSDVLNVYYKKDPDKKGPKPQKGKSEPGGGDLDRIEAVGNVKMVQLNRVVTGEKAVFLQDDQKIIVTGNPVMREGDNVIKGERIIVLLDENKGIVESSQKKRVTAVINPEKGKKK